MGLVVIGAMLVVFFAAERAAASLRKARIARRRSVADYPITGNDPVDRIIV